MNKYTRVSILVLISMTGVFGSVLANIPEPPDENAEFSKCCQLLPKGYRCSDAQSKIQCYKACQAGCGDPDGLRGKKCRQACDRWF